MSLPFTATREVRGEVVRNFFENLLPDSDALRERQRLRFGLRSTQAYELLAALGRDCVGAVQLLPEGEEPKGYDRLEVQPLEEREVEALLLQTTAPPLPNTPDDAFRISVAGAQEKTALTRVGDRWCRPRGATPTTHLLKLPLGLVGEGYDRTLSVQNEWLCMNLLGELGLPVARTEVLTFGTQTVLGVERFDRRWSGDNTWIVRLPQEDFCQALGVPPERKYESEQGPGIARCLQLLAGSTQPDEDRRHFLLAQLAFWLLGATDGHAKNFSLFLLPGGRYRRTPLYDVLSAWPILGPGAGQLRPQRARLAMALRDKNAHYRFDELTAERWRRQAERSGVPSLWDAMRALVSELDAALTRVEARLPRGFPLALWRSIAEGALRQARAFLRDA